MPVTINGSTGVVSPNGSAGTPAYQGADTNTGVFYPAADTVAIATNGTEAMRVDSSQNVGIGVTPTSFATVKALQLNTASTVMAFTDELDVAQNVYYNAGNKYITNAAATLYAQSGGQHLWYRAASGTAGNAISFSENARMDTNGNLLVGTQSALGNTAKVQISNGTGRAITTAGSSGDVSTEALRIGKFDNNSTTSQLFVRFTINNDGSGSGQINANGASSAAFGSFSDERLKENIVDLPAQLPNICALRPVEFDYKDGSGHQIGFIAQEMQAVYPDVVGAGDNDMLMITGWSKTEARLVKAIQEQQALITSLTARIAALEGAAQ
jgi:hypothetical protein